MRIGPVHGLSEETVQFKTAFVSFALLLAAVVPAAAQCPNEQAPGTVEGLMLNVDGTHRPNGVARFLPASGIEERLAVAGQNGFYRIEGLCPGTYFVEALDATRVTALTLQAGQTMRMHLRLGLWRSPFASYLAFIPLLFFAVGLLLFRHHNIVRTNRELLLAQIDNLKERIRLETDGASFPAETQELCERAHQVRDDFQWLYPAEWFFWSRGRELAAWTRLHELERQVVSFLVPEPRVVERAVYAETQLRAMNSPTASVVADRMRQTLQEIVATGGDAESHQHSHAIEHLKQQLGEGLKIIYDHTDTKFAGLVEWHNKAMLLVYLSLLAIGALGLVFRHEELFLVGAVGGLMSRMTRSLFREEVPNDYGASWTTLFLSPLLGAISAWVGITLIVWLHQFGVLGEAFGVISWHRPTDAVMIAMAFTLGFSERLFKTLLSKVEARVQQDLDKPPQAAAPPGPLTATAPAGARIPGGASPAPPGPSRLDRIVTDLDLRSGERAAFIGKATSPVRAALVAIVGASNLFDATPATLAQNSDLDAVLFEAIPSMSDLPSVATTLAAILRPDGRVVFVGQTPSALFDADAAAQTLQDHVGPAMIADALAAAGIPAQDPPEKLGGADPVEWIASFIQPAPGGSDR
jgi:hypothetical protein